MRFARGVWAAISDSLTSASGFAAAVVAAIVTALIITAVSHAAIEHRPLNCGKMQPRNALHCARAQLHHARAELKHPTTRHSPGYWRWRIEVTHRWIRQARYRIAWLHPHGPARMYAYVLTMNRWHSEAEWEALDSIISHESGWNPCAHYPGMSECGYRGSNACGIPQAYYCPTEWRGRLWESRYEQCRWLINYVAQRYGDPFGAVYARNTRGYY